VGKESTLISENGQTSLHPLRVLPEGKRYDFNPAVDAFLSCA
jgi:hypothetical protein